MAKSPLPISTSNGSVKKLIGALVLLGLFVLVVKYPTDAAAAVTSVVGVLGDAVEGLITFVRNVSN